MRAMLMAEAYFFQASYISIATESRRLDRVPWVVVADTCDQAVEALTGVFALLGKRWTGLVLAALMRGPVHYAELQRAVPGISERMLSNRLAELTTADLVIREVVAGPPLGVRYRVTVKGAALRPAMEQLAKWADEHFPSIAARSGCLTEGGAGPAGVPPLGRASVPPSSPDSG